MLLIEPGACARASRCRNADGSGRRSRRGKPFLVLRERRDSRVLVRVVCPNISLRKALFFTNMDVSDLLSRRRFAASLAGIVLAPAIVTSKNRVEVAGCMLTPEVTEGPYYVDDTLIRHEISESRPGVPLQLEIVVVDGRQCKAVPYAAVSVWHCDGSGVYSGYTAQSPNGPPGMPPGAHGRPPGPPPFRPGDDQGASFGAAPSRTFGRDSFLPWRTGSRHCRASEFFDHISWLVYGPGYPHSPQNPYRRTCDFR